MASIHWKPFLEFSSYEIWSGGPDPHLQLASEGVKEASNELEGAWRAGCYMAPYVVSTGAKIWEEWPLEEVSHNPNGFVNWIAESWPHWRIRRERRAARTVTKMATSLMSYADWVISEYPRIIDSDYETLWRSSHENILYFGRYANIKLLETLWRADLVKSRIPDIRPKDAWSPRITLAWIFPEDEKVLASRDNSPATLAFINQKVEELRQDLSEYMNGEASTFQIEVLLCNYRQVLDTRNGRYPGWSQDADLFAHDMISKTLGPTEFDFFGHRERLFPKEMLGEHQGWRAPRKELCGYKGAFWCDKLYDYSSTKDFNNVQSWKRRLLHDT